MAGHDRGADRHYPALPDGPDFPAGGASWRSTPAGAAPQGAQVGFVQTTGSIGQSVALAGGTYTLSFDAAQRAYSGPQTVEVLIDGVVAGTYTPSSSSYSAESATFSVPAGTHSIVFQGVDPSGADQTVFLDALQLTNNWTQLLYPIRAFRTGPGSVKLCQRV